jgi:hypothetical protein
MTSRTCCLQCAIRDFKGISSVGNADCCDEDTKLELDLDLKLKVEAEVEFELEVEVAAEVELDGALWPLRSDVEASALPLPPLPPLLLSHECCTATSDVRPASNALLESSTAITAAS